MQPPHPLCPPLFAGSQLPLGPLLPVRWSKPPIKGQLWGSGPGPNYSRLHLSRAPAPAVWELGRGPLPCCSAVSPGEGAGLPSRVQLLWISLLSGFRALSGFYGPLASCQGESSLCKPCLFRRSHQAGGPGPPAAASSPPPLPQPRRDPQAAAAGLGASRQSQADRA